LCYVGSESVGSVGVIGWLVWLGGGPGSFSTAFVVYGWSSSVAWATRRLVHAALRLVPEQGKPKWRLRARMCLFCAMVASDNMLMD
jgi:hypothetical protein